jgi:hypothetical protein
MYITVIDSTIWLTRLRTVQIRSFEMHSEASAKNIV